MLIIVISQLSKVKHEDVWKPVGVKGDKFMFNNSMISQVIIHLDASPIMFYYNGSFKGNLLVNKTAHKVTRFYSCGNELFRIENKTLKVLMET